MFLEKFFKRKRAAPNRDDAVPKPDAAKHDDVATTPAAPKPAAIKAARPRPVAIKLAATMTPILLPTRNRPNSLRCVLDFYEQFYPNTRIIVADGSDDVFKTANKSVVQQHSKGLITEYLPYPAELPLFDRLIDVLNQLDTEFVIMGSDDDFAVMETLQKGEAFLNKNPDFSTAMGSMVHLRMFSDKVMNVRLDVVRNVSGKTPDARVRNYSSWSFSTTYAVTRREHLIERYHRAKTMFLAGFYDFFVGCHDAVAGNVKAFPDVGFICTRNYTHSYLRATTPLIFLRKAEVVLEFNELLVGDLVKSGLDKDIAEEAARVAISRRVATLAGSPVTKTAGFLQSPAYQHPTVQAQFELFRQLFADGTAARAKYLQRLQFIIASLKSNAKSQDNAGEDKFYESIEAQLSAPPAAPARHDT